MELLPEGVHHLCPISLGLASAFVTILAMRPSTAPDVRFGVKGADGPPPSREEVAERVSISSCFQAQQELDAEPASGRRHDEAETKQDEANTTQCHGVPLGTRLQAIS